MVRRSLRSSSAANTPAKHEVCSAVTDFAQIGSVAMPLKSAYFSEDGSRKRATAQQSHLEAADDSSSASEGTIDAEASGYEDEDATASESSASEDNGSYESEESDRPRKKQKQGLSSLGAQARAGSESITRVKGKELWRPGVKTGLGPGTEVLIDAPKARGPGSIPYRRDTIHPNTMLFLKDLAQNNDRAWLKRHDPDYRASWNDFTAFLEALQEKLIEVDETIPELPMKDIIFRIYRDVRFSSDPTPYKTHFSAAWSRTGRKGPFACYYVQIKPKESFVGGGLWMPEAKHLAALRQDIDRKPHKIRQVLMNRNLRKHYLGNCHADEKKIIKAFVDHNAGNALKTKPKGYEADHRDIALMRLKNFTIGRKLPDDDILGECGIKRITELFEALLPFITYINSVVMPDGVGSGDDDLQEEDE